MCSSLLTCSYIICYMLYYMLASPHAKNRCVCVALWTTNHQEIPPCLTPTNDSSAACSFSYATRLA